VRRLALSTSLATLTFILACVAARAATPAPNAPTPAAPAAPASAASPTPAASPAPRTILRLSADRIDFYYNRFLIEADGNVRLQTSDGFEVSGDAFSMDLKLNRFLVAGHVTMRDASGQVSGAAIADFLDFRRIYLVPVTTEPDRWTFLNGDLAHPAKGRIMPGDVFYFPLISERPSITSTSAVIGTRTYVRFIGARTYLAGAPVPLGTYVVNFAPNQYFAANSLSGASADLTWNFAGNTNTLSALHLRYDPTYHTYFSIEQHFVGEHEYAIFSVNPATNFIKWWNMMLYEKLGSRFQISTFTQLYTAQHWLAMPIAAQQTSYLNATYALPHSYITATSQLTNYNVVGPGSLYSPPHQGGSLNHPSQVQITASSFQNRIADTPIFEQTYFGYGFNHDTVGEQYLQGFPYIPSYFGFQKAPINVPGLQAYGALCPKQYVTSPPTTYYCPVYTTIWNTVAGFNLFTQSIKLNNPENPYQTYYFNASFNKQRQWNSVPHYIDTTTTTATVSRTFARQFNSYLGYQVMNIGDHYINGGYAPCAPVGSQFCPASFAAFQGLATLRTLTLGMNFVPNPEFNASLLLRHHKDFPIPTPGLFPPPQPQYNVIGQNIYPWYLGQPPYDVTGEVRAKILPHMMLDIERTFYFYGYGNGYPYQFWSPNFVIQLLPI
jgi:hypothetical protein